jgi:hypothetical protein
MVSYKSFDQSKLENSILNIYQLANRQENTEGLVWYEIANRFARTIARKHDISLVQVAAIIAALSPATHWAQNIIDTEHLIIVGSSKATVSTYHRNKLKALKFLHGKLEPIDHYIGDKKYSWTKTASFFTNILNPTIAGKVTIDRHALRIAHGYTMTSDDAIYYGNTIRKYQTTSQAFFTVSKDLGLLPQQLQAITWLAYRRLYVTERYNRAAAIIL